jgi:hypothetical protein
VPFTLSGIPTEIRLAHQYEGAFRSVWKIVKFEDVFPDTQNLMNHQKEH